MDGDSIAVQITDKGTGIAPTHLARATLEQGYSTRVSLGMGFHLMLHTSDVLALSTTPQGTSILLRVGSSPRPSDEDALLARYVGL
jgi:anti-sigma regulatory factor (Ser/Thr protein kinase)